MNENVSKYCEEIWRGKKDYIKINILKSDSNQSSTVLWKLESKTLGDHRTGKKIDGGKQNEAHFLLQLLAAEFSISQNAMQHPT